MQHQHIVPNWCVEPSRRCSGRSWFVPLACPFRRGLTGITGDHGQISLTVHSQRFSSSRLSRSAPLQGRVCHGAPCHSRATRGVSNGQRGSLLTRAGCRSSPGRGHRYRVIAVGTALAGGPPRRSQRALLTHWAPALGTNAKAHVGKGMHNTGVREPSSLKAIHPRPADPRALAATLKRLVPEPGQLGTKGGNRRAVALPGTA